MKRKNAITLLFSVVLCLSFIACNNAEKESEEKEAMPAEMQMEYHDSTSMMHGEHAAMYECPMKCEGSASDKPGKCPMCDMDLVKVQE